MPKRYENLKRFGGAADKISLANYGVNRKMKKENDNREGAKKVTSGE
ncbi:MAG: hypothetical protein LBT46_00795 [Planctomycetaceae bacterium]|jgi:hypothetical protein|nr:hypothetical protein [Planctomycetaceae bacterium]